MYRVITSATVVVTVAATVAATIAATVAATIAATVAATAAATVVVRCPRGLSVPEGQVSYVKRESTYTGQVSSGVRTNWG